MKLYIYAGFISIVIILLVTIVALTRVPPVESQWHAPHYTRAKHEVDAVLERALADVHPALREQCTYAVANGRRVRGVIVLAVAPRGAPAVVAVEYLHAASLIVDDIMDGDTVRRGQATTVARYGHAAAQMTSVQLVAAAFQHLYAVKNLDADARTGLMSIAANTMSELSIGQWQEQQGGWEGRDIIKRKTSSLFEMAFLSGWLMRGGAADRHAEVQAVAHEFGELFQIVDDISDIDKDVKTNYAQEHGIPAARARCLELALRVTAHCRELEIESSAIQEIIDQLLQ